MPLPLDDAIKKAWGYASENACHIREDREPRYEKSELVAGIYAPVGNYLAKKK